MLFTRLDWRSAILAPGGYDITYPVNEVYIHHYNSGIRAPATVAAAEQFVRSAQSYHANQQGWGDIGYSFLFDQFGNVYEGRGWWKTGAHTYGFNSKGYGFCAILDTNVDDFSPACIAAMAGQVKEGIRIGAIVPNPTIVAHRDRVPDTSCCGDPGYRHLPEIRARVAGPSLALPVTAIPNDARYDMKLVRSNAGLYLLVFSDGTYEILNPGDETWDEVNAVMVEFARAGLVDKLPDGTPVVSPIGDNALSRLRER